MKCYEDIKTLAMGKYVDAQCLYDNGRYDSSYYIAGYCVELLIKSKVCRTLGIEDFFDFENRNKLFKDEGAMNKAFKVHNLTQLIVLSGIYSEFQKELKDNIDFKGAWSIIDEWNEGARYSTGKRQSEAKDLLTSIKKFEIWIIKHL